MITLSIEILEDFKVAISVFHSFLKDRNKNKKGYTCHKSVAN